jgi:adhesin transport system outer membrane protein
VATGARGREDTLAAVLRAAVVSHPTIKAREGDWQAAGFELEGAQWGWFPTVSAEAQADSSRPQTALRVQQPLWSGGRIESQIDVAGSARDAAQAAVREAEQSILLQTATAFFEVLRLEARLETARRNEDEHRKLLEMIQRRVRAEVSPQADETLAAARLQQAVSERIQFMRGSDSARVTLEQFTGDSVGQLIAPERLAPIVDRLEQSMLERARAISPERERLQRQLEVAKGQINLSRANTRPQVFAALQQQVGPLEFGQDRTRAFVGVEFRPGPGLSSLSAIQAASARLLSAEEALAAYDRQLAQQVRAALTEFDALQLQLDPARQLEQATDEVVASYLRQYQIGRKNWLDVLNAQREVSQARYALSDILFGIQSVQVRLLLLSGRVGARSLDELSR